MNYNKYNANNSYYTKYNRFTPIVQRDYRQIPSNEQSVINEQQNTPRVYPPPCYGYGPCYTMPPGCFMGECYPRPYCWPPPYYMELCYPFNLL